MKEVSERWNIQQLDAETIGKLTEVLEQRVQLAEARLVSLYLSKVVPE